MKRGLDRASAIGRGKSRGGAPKGERVPLSAAAPGWHPLMRPMRQSRLFGAPPPLIFLEAKALWLWFASSDAAASRERASLSVILVAAQRPSKDAGIPSRL